MGPDLTKFLDKKYFDCSRFPSLQTLTNDGVLFCIYYIFVFTFSLYPVKLSENLYKNMIKK